MKHPVLWIARHEVILAWRNRWVISFAALFAAGTLAISTLGMVTSGYSGFQDFVRTAASLVNFGGFLVPLFALLLGTYAFLSDPEHLELLATQPISRFTVLLGRVLGLQLTVLSATLLGFGLPGIVFSWTLGLDGALPYAIVLAIQLLLGLVFTGLAVMIVLLSHRQPIALGISIGIWLFFELVYGMLMLGATLQLERSVLEILLIVGLAGNPVDLARVLSLLAVGGPHLYGAAGATLVKTAGSLATAGGLGLAALLAWVLIPVAIALHIFTRQNL